MSRVSEKIGICFREYGLLPEGAGFFSTCFRLGTESAAIRKGYMQYARRIIEAIGPDRLIEFDLIVVVGDSLGDHRFFENLVTTLNGSGYNGGVEGHFFASQETAKLGARTDGSHLHNTWQELANAVSESISAAGLPLAFIDIDRTAIFPRGEQDDPYIDMRHQGFKEFIAGFRRSKLYQTELLRIEESIDFVSEHFADYCTNELAAESFKNDETIAAVGFMVCTGLVKKHDVSTSESLRELTRLARKQLTKGGWISGLYSDGDNYALCDGEKTWDQQLCADQLTHLEASLERNCAVFLPEFRIVESKIIAEALTRDGIPWNDDLLRAVEARENATVVYLTDKPAMTFGEEPEFARCTRPKSIFARSLLTGYSRHLNGQ